MAKAMSFSMNAFLQNPGAITLNWFDAEELAIMQSCLKIAAFDHYTNRPFITTMTGFTIEEFAAVLSRFGELSHLKPYEFAVIDRAVFIVPDCLGEKGIKDLLGISRLHLSWFSDKLKNDMVEWEILVEHSEAQDRFRQQHMENKR